MTLLQWHKAFVGLGLILGPGLASLGIVIGNAAGYDHSETIANLFMSVWAILLAVGVYVYLPSNLDLEKMCPHMQGEAGEPEAASGVTLPPPRGWWESRRELSLMFFGNLNRIASRLMWEAGAAATIATQFGWGTVPAGFTLSALGLVQSVAQLLYARRAKGKANSMERNHADLNKLEVLELGCILIMFGPNQWSAASESVKHWSIAGFLLGSLGTYTANCLTSAPYNAILMAGATNTDKDK